MSPLLSAFAMASLTNQSADNLVHRCTVQETTDGNTWTPKSGASNLPCRLSKPRPGEERPSGDTAIAAASLWVLALAAGSPYAGARLRFVVTGTEHGASFSRTLYSIGGLTPLAQTAEARVLCTEDPLAVAGT